MHQNPSELRGLGTGIPSAHGWAISLTILLAIYGGPAWASQYETVIQFSVETTPTAAHPCSLETLTPDPTGTFFYGEANYCGPNEAQEIVKIEPPAPGKTTWTVKIIYKLNDYPGTPHAGIFLIGGLTVDPSSGALYGVTEYGGLYNEATHDHDYRGGSGTLFKLAPNGPTYTYSVLHNFNGFNGNNPVTAPILDPAGNLIGETSYGGFGFIPAITNYTGSGVVYTFSPAAQGLWTERLLSRFPYPARGQAPVGHLLRDASSGVLYGVTQSGGAYGAGTVYMVDPSARGGLGERSVIYHFRGTGPIPGKTGRFHDGSTPLAGLIADAAGTLYGTTAEGGTGTSQPAGDGTIYMLKKDSSNVWKETILHNFAGRPNDGSGPYGDLVLVKGVLYGITVGGGPVFPNSPQLGTIFSLTPPANGKTDWTYNVLHNFDPTTYAPTIGQGGERVPLVADAEGNLYGLTGGPNGNQTQMFKFTP